MTRALALALLVAALPALAQGPLVLPAEQKAQAAIDPAFLRGHIRFLADDLLEGRGPGTRGDALAQAYLAAQLEALGLEPAGEQGTYFQPFELVGVEGHPTTLTATPAEGKGALTLRYKDDFIAVAGKHAQQSALADSELVFVGYGIVAPEYGWDDFKGADLKGKTLVILNSDPEDDPALFGGKARLWYGRWDYKYEQAARVGAAGAIIVHTTPSAGYAWQVVVSSWSGVQFSLPVPEGTPQLEVKAWTTEDATRRLLQLGGKDLDALRREAQTRAFRPVPLGVRVSTAFANVVERVRTANVVARLPGRDPLLAREAVLYTAHFDHLGVMKDAKPGQDAIYNGAVDNASGTAALLAVARAFKALPTPPRRSVLFAAVAAEEQGLLGSEYLAGHLPVPAGRIAANLNVDGLNVWGRTRDVTVIGLGKSSLDAAIVGLARLQGRVVKADQMADRGYFYRSDQFNFARLGIPAAYFGSGMDFVGRPPDWGKRQKEAWEDAHYHQPSDELRPDWDLSGAVEDVRLYFLLGSLIARQPEPPRWNEGDEFEATRRASLEALRGDR